MVDAVRKETPVGDMEYPVTADPFGGDKIGAMYGTARSGMFILCVEDSNELTVRIANGFTWRESYEGTRFRARFAFDRVV